MIIIIFLLGLCVASQYQWQFNIYSFVMHGILPFANGVSISLDFHLALF
jgi:hypothetical protein